MLTFAHSTYFHDLLESFSAGVVICNIRGLVYAANDAACRLLGASRRELADPANSAALIARADAPRRLVRFLAAPIKHGIKPDPLSIAYAHPDGTRRRYRLSGSLLLENEKIFGILIEITDVTEIYRLHERDRDRLLGVQAAQKERIEGLVRFSLAVAHQIRNPLMVIGGFTGRLLRGKGEGDPEAEALSMILDGAKRLEAVVRAVSDYARREEPAMAPCDPAALADRAFAEALRTTGGAGRLETAGLDGPLQADESLLAAILTQLCANALEAVSGDGAQVTVACVRQGETATLTVADNGPGPADDVLPYAFDPFFTTKAVGVGMGLTIARRRAEEMGGALTLERGPDGGGLARLTLPGQQ
jgi:PAS domain S-box-containing protein